MRFLLAPKSIAVIGASQRGGRGANVIANLRDGGFEGDIFAVNPRYADVHGYKCFAGVADLPAGIECLVVAVGADAACDVLEEAHAKGIPAAIVLAAGFGEGGHGELRAQRLRALASNGMRICGPNCFGLINQKAKVAAFSGPVPRPARLGSVAIVSQSGGLGATAFGALMSGRGLGFSCFVSCGNQLGVTIEDFVEYFVDDPDVNVVAIIIEALKKPRKLVDIARKAHAQRKTLLLYQAGRSAAGQIMVQSHTGALAGNGEVLAAFLRRCGIVQVREYDEFVEAIELFAVAPRDETIADDVIVVSGSGGGAAIVTDALDEIGLPLAQFEPATKERLRSAQPEFGSITNPIDGTGAMYDDPKLMPKIFDALVAERQRPVIAASATVRAGGNENVRRLADTIAGAARASGRTIAAYQYTPLGGPLDFDMIGTLHSAGVPVLLGIASAMRALRYLPVRRSYWQRADGVRRQAVVPTATLDGGELDFLTVRKALVASGIPVVDAAVAGSEDEAIEVQHRFGVPVAVKAEVPGLLHKSDIGCVRLRCADAAEVAQAYRHVIANARKAGFADAGQVLIQPMENGIAEAYAGVIDDPLFGPAICFGLGGIFVEVIGDVRTEMAPLIHEDAAAMIRGIKGASVLTGARGRPGGDIEALADMLVRLSHFAVSNAGRLQSLDLNPIVVKARGAGVVAVDIAIASTGPAPTAEGRDRS